MKNFRMYLAIFRRESQFFHVCIVDCGKGFNRIRLVFNGFTRLYYDSRMVSLLSREPLAPLRSKVRLPISTYTPGSEGSPALFDFVLPPPRQQVAHHATHQLLREFE